MPVRIGRRCLVQKQHHPAQTQPNLPTSNLSAMNTRILIATASLLASIATCHAAVLVSYLDNSFTVQSSGNNHSIAASRSAANTTPSTLADAVNGGIPSGDKNRAGFSTGQGNYYVPADAVPGGGVSNISSTPWVYFSIQAASGYQLDLANITFNFGARNGAGTLSYTPGYSVEYSLDDFATPGVVAGGQTLSTMTLGASISNLTHQADISLAALHGVTQSVTFRILFSDDSTNSNLSIRLDNLVVNGSVTEHITNPVVPEPAAIAALIGSAVLGAATIIRRRRRN